MIIIILDSSLISFPTPIRHPIITIFPPPIRLISPPRLETGEQQARPQSQQSWDQYLPGEQERDNTTDTHRLDSLAAAAL